MSWSESCLLLVLGPWTPPSPSSTETNTGVTEQIEKIKLLYKNDTPNLSLLHPPPFQEGETVVSRAPPPPCHSAACEERKRDTNNRSTTRGISKVQWEFLEVHILLPDFQPSTSRNLTLVTLAPVTDWFREEDMKLDTNHMNTQVKLFMKHDDGFKIK